MACSNFLITTSLYKPTKPVKLKLHYMPGGLTIQSGDSQIVLAKFHANRLRICQRKRRETRASNKCGPIENRPAVRRGWCDLEDEG